MIDEIEKDNFLYETMCKKCRLRYKKELEEKKKEKINDIDKY